MFKKPGMILLAIGVGGLLGSCHIEQEDVETISRTTEYLRVYQPNDFIVYNVIAITNSDTTSQGTLRVEWTQNDNLPDPVDNNITYPVLKETTTLTYEPGSTEADVTIIRYISQDVDTGEVTLYAIGGGTALYWLHNTTDSGNLSADIATPVIFDSPMAAGISSSVSFTAMEGCDDPKGTTCDSEIYTFTDNLTIDDDDDHDTTSVTTNLGRFSNPFEIKFIGNSIADDATTVSVVSDIRNVCGTSNDDIITHEGVMLVMPSIGIVRMTNLCLNGSHRVDYIITINDINF